MYLYTIADLDRGAGVFDHMMRSAGEFPSRHTEMPSSVAIGVVAAAMQSGLDTTEIVQITRGYFNENTAELLDTVRTMYSGDDRRVHLWMPQPDGTYALDRRLQYYSKPFWQIDRNIGLA